MFAASSVRGISSHVNLGLLNRGEDTPVPRWPRHRSHPRRGARCRRTHENLERGLYQQCWSARSGDRHANGNALQVKAVPWPCPEQLSSSGIRDSPPSREKRFDPGTWSAVEVLECLSLNQLERTRSCSRVGLAPAFRALLEPCANLGVPRVCTTTDRSRSILRAGAPDGAQRQTLGTAEATGRADAPRSHRVRPYVLQLSGPVRTHLAWRLSNGGWLPVRWPCTQYA